MSPFVIIDRLHRAVHTARATAALVGILVAPGAVLVAWAWGRQRREHAWKT